MKVFFSLHFNLGEKTEISNNNFELVIWVMPKMYLQTADTTDIVEKFYHYLV